MNKTLDFASNLINKNLKHVIEFGVCTGKTMYQLSKTFSKDFELFGFDSFEGLPEDWDGTWAKKGAMSNNGVVPNISGVTFYKGWFKDTIPEYKKVAKPIALLHVDCDLYSSTIDVLYGLKDYIVEGTVIVFDEWYYNHKDIPENRQHEQKAFFEWVNDYSIDYKEYPLIEDERKIIVVL